MEPSDTESAGDDSSPSDGGGGIWPETTEPSSPEPAEPDLPDVTPAAPDLPVDPPEERENVQEIVWGRAEILDAIAKMPVDDLQFLYDRWVIIFELNGLSPEFRSMTARQRLEIVERIVEHERERH